MTIHAEAQRLDIYSQLLTRMGEAQPQPRLHATRRALARLGDPHARYPAIHITGTNGKTSTSRIAESLLRAAGMRTGLFTSPHLVSFNERIVIDGRSIGDDELEAAWRAVAPALEATDAELEAHSEPPLTFFEAMTVLAYAALAAAGVDVAVIEVGMGGEWDSTNVIDGRVAVITPIALDHTRQLGGTVEEIAATKSGIIKSAARVVSAMQSRTVLEVIAASAERAAATLLVEGDDFGVVDTQPAAGGQLVTIRLSGGGRYGPVFLPLLGAHQAQNAAVALAAVEAFVDWRHALTPEIVASGFAGATSPGRLQLIESDPPVYLDAAHNPAGARAVAVAVASDLFDEVALVVGVLEDKDAGGVVEVLAAVAEVVFATQSSSDRAVPAAEIRALVERSTPGIAVAEFGDPQAALDAARRWAGHAAGRAVLVTGSITLVGDVLRAKAAVTR